MYVKNVHHIIYKIRNKYLSKQQWFSLALFLMLGIQKLER